MGGVLATPLIPIMVAQFEGMMGEQVARVIALNSGGVFALLGVFFFLQVKFGESDHEPQI